MQKSYNKVGFASGAYFDPRPLGAVEYSDVSLEALSRNNPVGAGRWFAKDGRDRLRIDADYDFHKQFVAGVPTVTVRTLAATASAASFGLAASPTYFVAPGAIGTTAMQYSTDGATWSQTTLVTPAATQLHAIIWAGSRFIAGVDGSAQPLVTTADNPNSTWTVTTGGTTTARACGLAYSPSLALAMMCADSGTSVYTLADGATAWTARTVTSSTRLAICWTGNRFFMTTQSTSNGLYHYSTDGVNILDGYNPLAGGNVSAPLCASDGNGTVVITHYNAAEFTILVSHDHGVSWGKILPPSEVHTGLASITSPVTPQWIGFINGRFVICDPALGFVLSSADGDTWCVERPHYRGASVGTAQAMAYKSGVYIGVPASSATSYSFTEDMSKFRMHGQPPRTGTNGSTSAAMLNEIQAYVKVRM